MPSFLLVLVFFFLQEASKKKKLKKIKLEMESKEEVQPISHIEIRRIGWFKAILHCCKYNQFSTNGVFLGTVKEGTLEIVDCVPLFHLPVLHPMLELSLLQVSLFAFLFFVHLLFAHKNT